MNYDLWRIPPQDLEPGPPEDNEPIFDKQEQLEDEIEERHEEFRDYLKDDGSAAYGYPPDWPKCPSCGLPALDGHITCRQAQCNEGSRR